MYLQWNFSGGLIKFCLFLQEWRFSRSRSSKVTDVGTNQKCACDFLLARNSNLGPILHHFGDMVAFMWSWPHPYFTLSLGCSRCTRLLMLGLVCAGTLSYLAVKLFSKYSKLCEKHTSTSRTDRLTDGQTTCNLITALCVASHGKNQRRLNNSNSNSADNFWRAVTWVESLQGRNLRF